MPLGLLESGWREADRAARGLLGPRRSSVFAIPPRAVWAQLSYPAANQLCRDLTGQGFSVQAWGLRARLLEANRYREACGHPMYEVHPELAFGAMAGAPLAYSKHTHPGASCAASCWPGPGSCSRTARPAPSREPREAEKPENPPEDPGDGHPGRGGRGLERLAYRDRSGRHPA